MTFFPNKKYLSYMRTDIDYIISLMKEYTPKTDNIELGEQDTPSDGGGSGGGSNAPSTWADIVGSKVSRGKANMLGKAGEKWESGLTRGPANQLK
jgi:hypothetical protein